jgi:hypothetical protein
MARIVLQATAGGSITNMRYVDDSYVLQANEHVYSGALIPDLNPCSIWDGATIQVNAAKWQALQALQLTDAELPRGTEDMIDVLIAKGVIAVTDLPAAAQTRHTNKKAARAAYTGA